LFHTTTTPTTTFPTPQNPGSTTCTPNDIKTVPTLTIVLINIGAFAFIGIVYALYVKSCVDDCLLDVFVLLLWVFI